MKTKLLSLRLTILLTAIFFSVTRSAQASHAVGASLTYTHLTGNQYRIHAIFYRDCISFAPTMMFLEVNSVSCNVSLTYQMMPLPGTGTEITLFCPPVVTCGYQKWEYEVDIPITGQCADWIFSCDVSSRDPAITTLSNPGADNLYIEARLNNVNADNNSPVFTNDPFIIIRNEDDFHYNLGMFDADGDSLAYRMIAPRVDEITSVFYNPGYSVLNPISSIPPVSIDPITGDLFIHPTVLEVGVIAIEILDYRNGEFMGSVLRDAQIFTVPSNNSNPTATHMNGTSQQFAYVFPGDTICFDIFSNDIDANDTVTMTWNATIPAASFTTAGSPFQTGTFCWIPTINDVRSQPHMFTAMVQDNFCTINNACIYSYFIYVTLDSSLVFLNASELSTNSDLSIYPNPSDGVFMLKQAENISSVRIFDYSGKIIQTSKPQEKRVFLDAPPGVYWIEIIYNDGKTEKQKLLIKK